MNNQIKLLDVVALVVDVPEHNLSRGQVGTVVELLKNGTGSFRRSASHTRWSSAIAMGALISHWACGRSN